jgi:methyl-accepting chemotaxis protein
MIKAMNLRKKLILLFLVIGSLPMLMAGSILYSRAETEIQRLAEVKAESILHGRFATTKTYFQGLEEVVGDLASLSRTQKAVKQFGDIFDRAAIDDKSPRYQAALSELKKFYDEQYAAEYKKQTGRDIDVSQFVGKLDPVAVMAQFEFIADNQNPLGQKNKMTSSRLDSTYSAIHAEHHPRYNDILQRHALYDVFIVDAKGRVVYTVFKELDFATDLKSGPWADSGLARAFEAGLKSRPGKVHIEDFAAYTPSYDGPAGFMSAPIVGDNGQNLGVLVVQFPIDKLNAIVADRTGLGETGDVILLGADGRLRTDTRRVENANHLKRQFNEPGFKLHSELWSKAVAEAKTDGTTVLRATSYDGLPVIGVVQRFQLGNLEWFGVVELGEKETLAGLRDMQLGLAIVFLLSQSLVALAAFWFGRKLAGELDSVSTLLGATSRQVSASSQQSASAATELSEAATEQAASLQETMASIEEISAMVNQNAESAVRAKSAVDLNSVASEDGSKSVDEMMRSIEEIRSTNDEILTHMESSNKEFGEIVKIISEIGEKTTIINDIVFQTKLLSFNASVEAARAGEHGKGFAVVAEEVGNLAQMSGSAAREITEMLTMSVKRVNSIVEQTRERVDRLVEVGQDKIAMGQSTAQKCRESLSKISDNAKALSAMVSEIAHASKEQAQGIQEINKAISQLDQVTQQNSAVAQQSSAQAEELSAQAEELQHSVEMLMKVVHGGEQEPGSAESSGASSKDSKTGKLLKMDASSAGKSSGTSKRSQTVASKTATKTASRRVSGSDVVPSHQDSGFEEF